MAVQPPNQLCQLPCILLGIILSAYQTVLKSQSSACFLKIIPTGLQHFSNRIPIGNGHQFRPFLLIGRMKRNGQGNLQIFLCQIIHPGHNAAGGHRDISLADMQPVFVRKHTDKSQKILVIIQRLSGSHDHYV